MLIKISKILLLLGGVLYSANSAAQLSDKSWHNFDYIKYSDPWLTSYNAAGLNALPINNISIAEIFANKKNGEFINYYHSNNSYEFGALTESLYRLNSKTVFYGKISYNNYSGKNMGGSVFINPYYNPFDIVEYVDTTRGEKNIENYNLAGAVSIDLYKGITIGGKIDYTVANYAKFKDLRHTNKLLDIYITAGLSYKLNKTLTIGANYFYKRSTEGIEFKVHGNTDRQYYSLINFGAFYGRVQPFADNGYTAGDENNPLFNKFNGVSVQADFNITPLLNFFNEITYKSRNGYYGKKSPSSIEYSTHNSDILEYKGVISLKKEKALHSLFVNIDNEKLENFENIYKYETPEPGGSSNIIYYDAVKMLDREYNNINIEYTGNIKVENFNPVWVLKTSLKYISRAQTVSMYPYFRKQKINSYNINVFANRNIINKNNMYGISLGVAYGLGNGTAKNDGIYANPSESQKKPESLDRHLYREYEYLTANRVKGDLGFRYSRIFSTGIKGYVQLCYTITKAGKIEYLKGSNFNAATISVGCTF